LLGDCSKLQNSCSFFFFFFFSEMEDRTQTNELYADPDFTEVTVAHKNRRNKKSGFNNQTILTAVTLCVAVIAIIVGSVAISRTNESNNKQAEVNSQNRKNSLAHRDAIAMTNGASTIISTLEFCMASPQNRQACLNVISTAEAMIRDATNPNITAAELHRIASDPALSKERGYVQDSKLDAIDSTTDTAGSNTGAQAVITDGEGHMVDGEGKIVKFHDKNGEELDSSALFDTSDCLLVWKEKLCLSLVPVGDTAISEHRRRRAGGSKYDIAAGHYMPVVHITDGRMSIDADGNMRRRGGNWAGAVMGCQNGAAKGGGWGAKIGNFAGSIFHKLGTSVGAAAGKIAGEAIGCAVGGWKGYNSRK
jgi:hypothetical protein